MKVIALVNRKGGCGKTTLSGHLACEADRLGLGRVALLDADPQGSLTEWWNAREAETPMLLTMVLREGVPAITATVAAARSVGIDWLIIDTPPSVSSVIEEVIQEADLCIIPITPSPHDLRAAGRTVDIVEAKQVPLLFVLNNANQRARITLDAVTALSEHGPVAATVLHQRTDYRTSMITGRTVGEVPAGKVGSVSASVAEVSALWAGIHTRMQGEMRRGRA